MCFDRRSNALLSRNRFNPAVDRFGLFADHRISGDHSRWDAESHCRIGEQVELPGRHTIDGDFSDASAADRMRHRVSVLPCCVMIPDKDDGIIAAIYIADHGIRAAHLAADQLRLLRKILMEDVKVWS